MGLDCSDVYVSLSSDDDCPYQVGDQVMALWALDNRKYPARVTKVVNSREFNVNQMPA